MSQEPTSGRHTLFDVFGLDKSETDPRAIQAAVRRAESRRKSGQLRGPDGAPIALSESELNHLKATLLDPLARLRAEQLIHQGHSFASDDELAQALAALAAVEPDPVDELLAFIPEAITAALGQTLAQVEPPTLEDDLPWPDEPGVLALELEPLEELILRDR